MRRSVIAGMLLVSSSAHADWKFRSAHDEHCGDNLIVGQCGSFASGWTPPMLRLELGPVMHRTHIGPMVGTDEDGRPTGRLSAGGDLESRGFGGRFTIGYRGFYFPTEVAVSTVDGPAVYAIDSPAAAAIVDDGSSSGWNITTRLGLGKELRFGRLMLGGELALGIGIITLRDQTRGQFVTDPRFLLDARVHVGVWLTPHISLRGHASASIVREGERMFGLSLGFSLFPWDGVN